MPRMQEAHLQEGSNLSSHFFFSAVTLRHQRRRRWWGVCFFFVKFLNNNPAHLSERCPVPHMQPSAIYQDLTSLHHPSVTCDVLFSFFFWGSSSQLVCFRIPQPLNSFKGNQNFLHPGISGELHRIKGVHHLLRQLHRGWQENSCAAVYLLSLAVMSR